MPISTRKFAALLMLYPTETLDLLPPDERFDTHFEHQKRKKDRAPQRKRKKKSPRNGLFKPFLGLFGLAGAEGLEPSARGFGDRSKPRKPHRYADLREKRALVTAKKQLLMLF